MKIKLNKTEIKAIRFALFLASEWETSVIDSHLIGLRINKKKGQIERYIPKEHKKYTNQCLKNIIKFEKIREKLKSIII